MWCQVRLGQNRYDSKSLKTQNLFDARLGKVGIGSMYTDMLGFVRLNCKNPTKNIISANKFQQTMLGARLG